MQPPMLHQQQPRHPQQPMMQHQRPPNIPSYSQPPLTSTGVSQQVCSPHNITTSCMFSTTWNKL